MNQPEIPNPLPKIEAGNYSIHFNDDGYKALAAHLAANHYSGIFIITDTNSNLHCVPVFLEQLATTTAIEIIEFESGESFKSIETCVQIWNVLTELGADRKSLIINLGGGVVTDLGGFVASAFKRGIAFIHIPTTLLAMVDAAIGGKNGVDLGSLKNQVGLINTPKMVVMDTGFLATLPQNEMRSGLAEMLKHGLIYDKKYWQQFLDLSAIDYADFDTLIYTSVKIKNEIVLQDPTEKGIRKALNFGHTLGHAIESLFLEDENKETLLHGEAVAAGMILESYLSLKKGLLNEIEYAEIKSVIKSVFEAIIFDQDDIIDILALLIHDKKNEYGQVQFALINGIGSASINERAENEMIIAAFEDYKS